MEGIKRFAGDAGTFLTRAVQVITEKIKIMSVYFLDYSKMYLKYGWKMFNRLRRSYNVYRYKRLIMLSFGGEYVVS